MNNYKLNIHDFTAPDMKEFWFLTAVLWRCCIQCGWGLPTFQSNLLSPSL